MKDYASMSDFEISRLVGDVLGVQWANLDENYHELCYWPELDDELRIFNPCNNPADAWPIMLESKISIMWQTAEESWCAWANGDLEGGCWDWRYCPDDYHVHASALRAAMTVFLMMKEGEK